MATNYYQHYPIHPHQRYHGNTASNSAYTRNNSMSWQSNNKSYSSAAPRLKNVRMVEPTTMLSDYRHGGSLQPQNQMSFAPIHQTQKYDGKAILERTQKRIQEAHRKRGNLVEGRMRPIAKEPKKLHVSRPKIQNSVQKPIIQPDIQPIINAKPVQKSVSNQSTSSACKPSSCSNPASKPASKQTSKINLELPITSTKIAIKSAEPPSVRNNDLKPQPNANNDWSTNYNDDFRNWQSFKRDIKKKQPLEEFVTAGQTATHHLNAEKRKYMERMNREEKAKKAKALAEKKQKQQESIEKRRLDTQKVLDNLSKENQENNASKQNDKENNGKSATRQPFSTTNSKFQSETTSTSTFKRWPKSAFQTVASRSAEKPIWAAPNGSQHFPVKQPRQKILKDSTKHNMNITLTIDGKSMGSRSVPKVGTDFKKQQNRNSNKSKFMSEYQSKFKKPGYV